MKGINPQGNLLATFHNNNLNDFKWLNEPDEYSITANAPFLYREISGDFIATAILKPDFSDMWNA